MQDPFENAVAHLEKARDEGVKNVDMLQDEVADHDPEMQMPMNKSSGQRLIALS